MGKLTPKIEHVIGTAMADSIVIMVIAVMSFFIGLIIVKGYYICNDVVLLRWLDFCVKVGILGVKDI